MNFWPELSLPVQHAFQSINGMLLLLVLGHQLAPHWRRLLTSDRWGGSAQSGFVTDLLHRPALAPMILVSWAGCAVALICDWQSILASAINVALCRYYFVAMRWRGVGRGYGAPGFMTYWLSVAVLLLAVARLHAPSVQPLAIFWLQVDLALIIFSSGIYKLRSGYRLGEGMDYGLVNPMWSYWPDFFRKLPTSHPVFRFLNQSAWISQLVSTVLMLLPVTRWLGGLAEMATYLFIATQIRLGWLAEQMMLTGLLFFTVGSPAGRWWDAHWSVPGQFTGASHGASAILVISLQTLLWLQLILTPLCHAGLFFNYYGRRRLPAPLQRLLDAYANFFGIIIWRVFSVDHLNFHVNVHHAAPAGGTRILLSKWSAPGDLRFWHVGEAITVTSLFTTLKYYPADSALFRDRVFRYAQTLSCPAGHDLIFSYHAIRKVDGRYADRLVCEYHVNPRAKTMRIIALEEDFSAAAAHGTSPLHPGTRPGSYAPA